MRRSIDPRHGAVRGKTAFDAGRRSADAVRKRGSCVLACHYKGKPCARLEKSLCDNDLSRFDRPFSALYRQNPPKPLEFVAESRQAQEAVKK